MLMAVDCRMPVFAEGSRACIATFSCVNSVLRSWIRCDLVYFAITSCQSNHTRGDSHE